jgi:dipeptidyl aminopeptidase/acylaminoacyl peptidase
MKSIRMTAWPILAALMLAPMGVALSIESNAAETLIPRKDVFGNPERSGAQVSPDGKWISFIAPRDGMLNIWVAPFGKIEEAKPLTSEKVRPIRNHFWATDSSTILYMNDVGGDENFLLFRVDPTTGETKKLTDFPKTRVFVIGGSWAHPDQLVIGLNNRDPKWHDVYNLNIKTGELKLLHENKEEYSGFTVDDALQIRFATKDTADAGQEVFKIAADGSATSFMKIPADDALTTGLGTMTVDGKTIYMIDTRDRDKAALIAVDAESGATSVVGQSDKADVSGSIDDPATGRVLGYSVNYIKTEWTAVDDAIKADVEHLNQNLQGQWFVSSQSKDNNVWLLVNDAVVDPVSYYSFDRSSKTLTKLFSTRPALDDAPLADMHGVEIASRDGKTLVSYLTLPVGSDADNNGKPEQALPMVLNVHGGPWARDNFGYRSDHQWLANRGYAVLSVNYRGSSGFGKSFINAADREWGGKMHDDLLDAVKWAVDNGVAQQDKVCIYGGSYGGYATLVGLTFTPTTFACGAELVGPSNLQTFLATIPPYWESSRPMWRRRLGDESTPEGIEFLKSRSPITKVDQIQRPLLIGQGANDPRVVKAESDQIVEAMKAKNIPVTYVNYPDEGHGFARPENRTSFYAITEAFFAQTLGGQFEPVGDDFKGSSLEVLEGAEHVPGLKEALERKQASAD